MIKGKAQTNYHGGLAAEGAAARDYERRGYSTAQMRWRGGMGEIDLITRFGAQVVFVEVKKSTSFDRAAARVSRTQMDRIMRSATEFVAGEPMGQDTEMRFDVALVDQSGCVQIIENAFQEA